MSQKNYWLKNGIVNIFQNLSGVLFGVLSFSMLVRVLNKESYGLWAIFLGITAIVEMAKNGLTQEATIKYLSSANRVDKRKIVTASFFINISISVFIVILTFCFGFLIEDLWHSKELVHMLYLYTIVFIVSGVLSQLNYFEQASLRFKGVFYAAFTRQFLFFLYIAICYLFHFPVSLISLAIVQIINVIIATLLAYYHTKKIFRFTRQIDWSWVKKLFNFGKYSFGVSLSFVLSGSIDQMMLGSMVSKAATGTYNVALRITNIADVPINSMATILFPQASLRIETDGPSAIKYLYEKSVGVILGILTPALFFVYIFSDLIIFLLAGETYKDAAPLLHITLLTCIFAPYGRQVGTILASSGKTRINFYLILINTIVLIILNYFFIKIWGILGVAYATLLASIISFTVGQVILNKLYNVNFLNPWKYAVAFYPEFYNKYIKGKLKARSNH